LQTTLSIDDHSESEGTHAQLNHCTVVAYLCPDIGLVDRLLKMGSQEHIASSMELILKRKVVDVI
jgi:hypothetical protein